MPAFQNREKEISQITDLTDRNIVLNIYGEAGIGKSRLLHEAARRIHVASPSALVLQVDLKPLAEATNRPGAIIRTIITQSEGRLSIEGQSIEQVTERIVAQLTKLADLVPVVLMFDATEVLKSDTELCHWMEWNLIDPLAKSQVRQVFASRVPMRWRSFHVRRVMSAMILDPLSLQDTARNLVREMLQQHNAHLKSEETEQAIRLVLAFSFGNPLLSEEIAGHVAKRWTMTTTDRLKRDLCKQVVKPFIERCFLGDIEQPWDKIVWWISVLDRFDVAMLRRYLSQVVPILTTDWSVGFILDGLGQMTDLGLVVWQDEGGYRLCGAIEDIVRHCLATLEPERYRRACQAAAQAFETSVHRFSGDAGKYRRRAVVGINDSRVIEPLIAELQHANKDVRRAAVEALREIGIPSVRCLIVALQDKDKDVRGAAAWALGKMDDPQAVDSLIAALRDDEWLVRQAIINALGEIGAPSIDPLTATLQDESKDVRQSAVYALARIGISAVQPLLAALQDKDVEVRWAAARALRQIGDPTATEALIAALRDSDSDVRRIAAQALGQIGGPMVAEPLIAALQDEDVRDAAVEALGRIHALQSAELLTIILQDDKRNVYTRQAAAEALGRIGNPDSVKPLITFLADQDESIRLAAIEALGRIGAPAVRSLITSLRNEDGSMRWAAAKALQEVGDPAVRPLVAVLGDGDVNVRQSAAWALGRLGIPQATEPLKALLQDQELSVRRVAARALEQIRAAEPMASKDYEMARQSVFGRRQPCEPIALHYSDVSFPAQTSIGQVAALRVAITLTPKSEQAAELALEMPPGYTGTMQVDACVSVSPADFDVYGPNIQTIDVSIESDSTPIIFKIAPKSMGRKSIAVEFFQNARYLGRAEVETDVVEEPRTAQDVFAHLSLTVHPHPSAPDLVVYIETIPLSDGRYRCRFFMFSPMDKLNLRYEKTGQVELQTSPQAYFESLFAELTEWLHEVDLNEKVFHKRLSSLGANLYDQLFPEELKRFYWERLRNKVKSVQLVSIDPWIPWELVRPYHPETLDEDDFLCERFALTRWLVGSASPDAIGLDRMALIVATSDLESGTREAKALRRLPGIEVQDVPPSLLDIYELLESGGFKSLHFACHGEYDRQNPDQSAVYLEGGQRFRPNDIAGKKRAFGRDEPLVFLNACETGRAGLSLTGQGGWARAFIQTGAAGFVGSMWEVQDKSAFKFAVAFYRHLLKGKTVAEAVRLARQSIKRAGDPTWLSYTVYANPLARLAVETATQT